MVELLTFHIYLPEYNKYNIQLYYHLLSELLIASWLSSAELRKQVSQAGKAPFLSTEVHLLS